MSTKQISEYQYDVFLSHNSDDKDVVERIAAQLEDEAGLKPFLDKWHLVPGEPWQESLEEALDLSATCAVFLGPNGLGPWENEEMRSALEDRVHDKSFRVIPVLLPGANPKRSATLPRFLRRLTWVDFRQGLNDQGAFRYLVAGICGNPPGRSSIAKVPSSCLGFMIVHALPPAPTFVGCIKELEALNEFWQNNRPGVLSLTGMGGAGKTAIVAEFLDRLSKRADQFNLATPDTLFVWSFYVDQDIGAFLKAALYYFSDGQTIDAKGSGALYLLTNLLAKRGRCLIVMDGLERIQRSRSDPYGMLGELENPLFRQVVSRLALGVGLTKCLITSRFPITDLHPWKNQGYQSLHIEELERSDACRLLRLHGVKGKDIVLERVIDEYGGHALTLDHLAVYLSAFCSGDPSKASELEEPRIDSDIPQEHKLSRVLQAYEKVLTDKELALLSRLCVFYFSITVDTMHSIFSQGDRRKLVSGPLAGLPKAEFQRIFDHLVKLHLVLVEATRQYTVHPAIRDHFYHLFTQPKIIHDAVYKHLGSLTKRPGTYPPKNKETLDLLEEVIHQALQIGDPQAAEEIFDNSLGGHIWLININEISRGYRISAAFPEAHFINKQDRPIFLRYLGDPTLYADTFAQSDGLILLGMLRKASDRRRMGWDIAEFLMGKRKDLIDVSYHGDIITSAHVPLYQGDLIAARQELIELMDMIAVGDDYGRKLKLFDEKYRFELIFAEIERQERHLGRTEQRIKKAEKWILNSGSQEHLCLLHLMRTRLAIDKKQFETAQTALIEGLHIAERCSFGLYHIDLLNEQARLHLLQGNMKDAERAALCALNGTLANGEPAPRRNLPLKKQQPNSLLSMIGAKHPECQYAWGEAEAGHLLGEALIVQGHKTEARKILESILALRKTIGHYRTNRTEQLLASLR